MILKNLCVTPASVGSAGGIVVPYGVIGAKADGAGQMAGVTGVSGALGVVGAAGVAGEPGVSGVPGIAVGGMVVPGVVPGGVVAPGVPLLGVVVPGVVWPAPLPAAPVLLPLPDWLSLEPPPQPAMAIAKISSETWIARQRGKLRSRFDIGSALYK
ncbi:MAG: hypothetical protein V4754_13095 [Pseudomonadota bacterium]